MNEDIEKALGWTRIDWPDLKKIALALAVCEGIKSPDDLDGETNVRRVAKKSLTTGKAGSMGRAPQRGLLK